MELMTLKMGKGQINLGARFLDFTLRDRVPREQPDALSGSIVWCRETMLISTSLVAVRRAKKSRAGLPTGAPTMKNEGLD